MSKPTSPALQSGNSLATGLVACYLMNEGSGSLLRDYSASGNNATFGSAPAWATDPEGDHCLSLDGTKYATAADANLPTGARSFAFRFKTSTHGYPFSYGTSGSADYSIGVDSQNPGSNHYLRVTTLSAGVNGTHQADDNAWHVGVITDDGTSVKFYLDSIGADTFSSPTETTTLSGTSYIGGIGGTTLPFAGLLDGIQGWNRVISGAEVTSLNADFWQAIRGTAPALSPGTATAGSTTASTASATATEATGGTSPYTHQWFRSTTSGSLGAAVSGQTSTTLADSGLAASTAYYYTLQYTDSASGVVTSNQVAETTSAAPVPTTATFSGPSTGTTGSASTSFTVTLNNPAPTGGTPVTIGDSNTADTLAGGGVSGGILTIQAGQVAGSFTVSRPTNGASTLAPTASGITFTPSSLTYTASTPSTPPSAPTGVTATAGNAQVVVAWTLVSGAASYSVFRGTTAGGESSTAVATGVVAATFTNTGLANGTTYFYTVKAVNTMGSSAASAEASATPVAPSGPTPIDPAVTTSYVLDLSTPGLTVAYEIGVLYTDNSIVFGSPQTTVTDLGGGFYGLIMPASTVGYIKVLSSGSQVAIAWIQPGTSSGGSGGISLTDLLGTPRALDSAADGTISVKDALWSAVCGAAGKQVINSAGTGYTVETPSSGTAIRTFTLSPPLTQASRS